MEARKARMIVNTGGNGGSTFRATLPTNWVRKMGLSEDIRDLKLEFDGEKIVITNNAEEMKTLNDILEQTKKEISAEMDRAGYIDESDDNERFIDELTKKHTEENEKLDFDEVLEMVDDYMKKTYKRKGSSDDGGHYAGCYYKDKQGLEKWNGFNE